MDAECESPNCGSTSFRVGDDGYTYCFEGHRQTIRGTQIADDNEGAPQFGKKARRELEADDSIDTTLSGKRAVEHYLLCFQLVLWKQVHWLINVKKLPKELETVVRDLWGLRLQTLQSRATYESESEADLSSQLFSSQSEGEHTDNEGTKHRAKRSKTDAIPQLTDALSLCYTGVLLLRLPMTVNDLYCWATSGQLVYYRAIRTLSPSMKQRLPFNFARTLDPNILQGSALHKAVLDNIAAYNQAFGMIAPPLNHVLILYRWVKALALPLEVYSAVLRIAKLLAVDFAWGKHSKRASRYNILGLPEARLMALLVIATKLLFPMDNVKRSPRRATELSALAMDWHQWDAARIDFDEDTTSQRRMGYEDALKVSEGDVMHMSEDKLDEYMDWYADVFAEDTVKEKGRAGREAEFRRAMLRFFPVERPASSSLQPAGQTSSYNTREDERLARVQGALQPVMVRTVDVDVKTGEPISRPGSHYKRYRNVEEIEGYAKRFYEEAAKLIALPLDKVVRCVFLMERRLEEWEATERQSHRAVDAQSIAG